MNHTVIEYFEKLEAALKLVDKYKLEELSLPDGTRIVKKLHLGKPAPKKKEPKLPVNQGWEDDLPFISSKAAALKADSPFFRISPSRIDKDE